MRTVHRRRDGGSPKALRIFAFLRRFPKPTAFSPFQGVFPPAPPPVPVVSHSFSRFFLLCTWSIIRTGVASVGVGAVVGVGFGVGAGVGRRLGLDLYRAAVVPQ